MTGQNYFDKNHSLFNLSFIFDKISQILTSAKIFVFFDDITFSYSKLYLGFSTCKSRQIALPAYNLKHKNVPFEPRLTKGLLLDNFLSEVIRLIFSGISILSKRKNLWNRQKSKNGDDVVEPNKCRWLRWMNEHQTSFVFWCVRFIINQYSRDS